MGTIHSFSILAKTAVLWVLPIAAQADGFGLSGHSVEGVSVSHAGSVAGYSDGSGAYLNPASLTSIEKPTVSIGAHYIPLKFDMTSGGSTAVGGALQGSDTNEHDMSGVIPNFYGVIPLSDRVAAGLYLNVPFGLGTKYPSDWVGRYQATTTELTALSVGASLGVEILDGWSIGGRLGGVHAEGRLENTLDFGTIGFAALGPETATQLGLTPQGADGAFKVRGEDWGLSWAVGTTLSYGDQEQNRLGVALHGATELNLHGDSARFSLPPQAQPLTTSGAFVDTPATVSLTLPETVMLGGSHWITPHWEALYQSQWTRWTQLDTVSVRFENPAQPTATENYGYETSWKHSIGASYYPEGKDGTWRLGAGFMYDRSPVRNLSSRSPRIPDSDQYWFSTGLSYRFCDSFRTDLAYAFTKFAESTTERAGSTGDVLRGTWNNSFQVFSLGFVWSY